MPPVFGPSSPSRRRLWSCEVASGSTCVPSTMAMKLASSPSRNSSITTLSPALPKRPSNIARVVVDGFLGRGADHHALAGGEAIGLHHERRLLCAHPCRIEALARERAVGGRGDAVALEEILGECLRAFELRREAARAEAAQAGRLEGIDYAEHQRPLGADDGQVDLRGQRVAHEAVDVLGGNCRRCAPAARAPCRRCPARRGSP